MRVLSMLLILIISLSNLQGQKFEFDLNFDIREVYISIGDTMIQANIYIGDDKIKIENSHKYYWYKKDMILTTRGGYNGNILHGEYTVYYPDKNLKEKGQFDKGLKHGEWKEWYDNGELKTYYTWKNGVLNGKYAFYNTQDELVEEGTYKKGELVLPNQKEEKPKAEPKGGQKEEKPKSKKQVEKKNKKSTRTRTTKRKYNR